MTLIERHFDAHQLNRVVNHPEVHRWVCGRIIGKIDLSSVVADQRNILLMGEYGGVLFAQLQGGLYEAHTSVLPEGRGTWTLAMVRAALHWMFCRTDAVEIMTRVPRGNLGARALAKAIGGRREFSNPGGWIIDNAPVSTDVFALRIQDWMRDAPGLVECGRWFHRRLEQEYARLGKTEPQHADDETHDRYVGIAAEMVLAGQPQKAAIFYNRWAVMAGYEPVTVVSANPVAIDIHNAVIGCRDGDLWVISCR
jgi:RimJ/RimL family protein N-acetyltransferase